MKRAFTCWRSRLWGLSVLTLVFGLIFAKLWLPSRGPSPAERVLDVELPKMQNVPPDGSLKLEVPDAV
jgi:hypothetical protein